MLYRGRRIHVAGESFDLPATNAKLFRRLADRRIVGAGEAAELVADAVSRTLLHQWWQHGWILIDDGVSDGAR
jgi:hypothetical protein